MSILDTIDGAIDDWNGSVDAMRWSPPPVRWDEPVVRDPRDLVERLTLEGWDGYAANGYVGHLLPIAIRQFKQCIQVIGERYARAFRELARVVESVTFTPPRQSGLSLQGMVLDETHIGTANADARQRALDARRNRNTGPKPPRLDRMTR